MINTPLESSGHIDIKYINEFKSKIKDNFYYFLINYSYGLKQFKLLYCQFVVFNNYHKSVKFLCTKVCNNSKKKTPIRIYNLTNTPNIIDIITPLLNKLKKIDELEDIDNACYNNKYKKIKQIISRLNLKNNYSFNDDKNYILLNESIDFYLNKIKLQHHLKLNDIVLTYDKNVFYSFFYNMEKYLNAMK